MTEEEIQVWRSIDRSLQKIAMVLDEWANPKVDPPPPRRKYDIADLSRPSLERQAEIQREDRERRQPR